jgi:hypothetical protein
MPLAWNILTARNKGTHLSPALNQIFDGSEKSACQNPAQNTLARAQRAWARFLPTSKQSCSGEKLRELPSSGLGSAESAALARIFNSLGLFQPIPIGVSTSWSRSVQIPFQKFPGTIHADLRRNTAQGLQNTRIWVQSQRKLFQFRAAAAQNRV